MKRYLVKVLLLILVCCMCASGVYAQNGGVTSDFSMSGEAEKMLKDLNIMRSFEMDAVATYEDLRYAVNQINNSNAMDSVYYKSYKSSESVSYVETVAVLLDMLGYTTIVGANDEYNAFECMKTANRIGLIKGISLENDSKLTVGQLGELIYRALNTDMMQLTGVKVDEKENEYEYVKKDGYTLLYDRFKLKKLTGVVNETELSSLIRERRREKRMVTIEQVEYRCDVKSYEDYLGMYVEAYVSTEDNTVKTMYAPENNNGVLIVDADDVSIQSKIDKLVYFDENGKKRFAKIATSASVVLNGSLHQNYATKDYMPDEGNLVLIDNDDNGVYDVVRIESYKSIVTAGVSVNSGVLRPRGSNDTIDIQGIIDGYGILCDAEGKVIPPDKIDANTVVSYAENSYNEVYKMIYSDKKISGYVNEIIVGKSIKLEDYTYECTADFWRKPLDIQTGDLVWAYINYQGKIVEFDKERSFQKYGFLMDFGLSVFSAKVKIFTSAGTMEIYEVAENVVLNGQKMSAKTAFDENRRNSPFWNEAGKIPQLVKYQLDKRNCISTIQTAISPDEKVSDNDLILNISGNRKWFGNAQAIDPMVRLNNETMIFSIPYDEDDEWDYSVQGYNNLWLGSGTTYTCKIYDVDEDCYAKAVVIKRNTSNPGVDRGMPLYLVTKTGVTLNDSGETVPYFEYVQADGTTDYMIAGDKDILTTLMFPVSLSEIKVGSVVQITMDWTNSELSDFICYAHPDSNQNNHMYEYCYSGWGFTLSKTAFYSDNRLISFGEVRRLVKDGMVINNTPLKDDSGRAMLDESGNVVFDEEYNRLVSFPITGVNVKMYDGARGRVYDASVADIQPGDKVLVDQAGGVLSWIIVYRNV